MWVFVRTHRVRGLRDVFSPNRYSSTHNSLNFEGVFLAANLQTGVFRSWALIEWQKPGSQVAVMNQHQHRHNCGRISLAAIKAARLVILSSCSRQMRKWRKKSVWMWEGGRRRRKKRFFRRISRQTRSCFIGSGGGFFFFFSYHFWMKKSSVSLPDSFYFSPTWIQVGMDRNINRTASRVLQSRKHLFNDFKDICESVLWRLPSSSVPDCPVSLRGICWILMFLQL